jgi:hypothetical protein
MAEIMATFRSFFEGDHIFLDTLKNQTKFFCDFWWKNFKNILQILKIFYSSTKYSANIFLNSFAKPIKNVHLGTLRLLKYYDTRGVQLNCNSSVENIFNQTNSLKKQQWC